MRIDDLKDFLDEKVLEYNTPGFIPDDPVSIPHKFSQQQDIEIAGYFAAILAWGQRKTIINKCNELLAYMDWSPFDFIMNHSDEDLKPLEQFKHRTFNATDLLYFVQFFKTHYQVHESLEQAFIPASTKEWDAHSGLIHHRNYFFALPDHPQRTYKHVATPARNSACKRLNMFLRWMVRQDDCGVDFGLWKTIKPEHLICPCDVHVDRVARKLGMINRKQTDWKTAVELTENLKQLDPKDPVKYDFALFGLGVEEKF